MDDEMTEAAAAIMMENSSSTAMADERGYGNGFWEFSWEMGAEQSCQIAYDLKIWL